MITANETKKITNKIREDNADSIMNTLIKESEEKIKSAAEAGLDSTVVSIRCFPVDEVLFKRKVYSYFEQLGYKVTCTIYDSFGTRRFQVVINWGDNNGV